MNNYFNELLAKSKMNIFLFISIQTICISGGGAYKDLNQDEVESKATDGFSFVARNQTSVLPGWNLKF